MWGPLQNVTVFWWGPDNDFIRNVSRIFDRALTLWFYRNFTLWLYQKCFENFLSGPKILQRYLKTGAPVNIIVTFMQRWKKKKYLKSENIKLFDQPREYNWKGAFMVDSFIVSTVCTWEKRKRGWEFQVTWPTKEIQFKGCFCGRRLSL